MKKEKFTQLEENLKIKVLPRLRLLAHNFSPYPAQVICGSGAIIVL